MAALRLAAIALASGCFIEPKQPAVTPEPAATLVASSLHACAIDDHGVLACWGDNAHGQIGSAGAPQVATPATVDGTWSAVAAGDHHTCAIAADGVYCWGDNRRGQCGVSALFDVPISRVELPAQPVRVFAGADGTCAIDAASRLWCWGDVDKSRPALAVPTQIAPGGIADGWVHVALTDTHACARNTSGGLYCWGQNGNGELGNANGDEPYETAQLVPGGPYLGVAIGHNGSCAIDAQRDLSCWGRAALVGSSSSSQPVSIDTSGDWTDVAVADAEACGVSGDRVYCFGQVDTGVSGTFDPHPSLDHKAPIGTGVAIALGDGFACSRGSDASVACWGSNTSGELGTGEIATERTPFDTGIQAITLTAGDTFTCALETDRTLWCWGDNREHQIAAADRDPRELPTQVSNTTYAQVAAGRAHVCAMQTASGRLIDCTGAVSSPGMLPSAWQRMMSGGDATCGVDSASQATCFGAVPGTATNPYTVPNPMLWVAPAGGFVVELEGGGTNMYDWGKQCTGPDVAIASPAFVAAAGASSNAQLVAAGDRHACVAWTGANTTLECWGSNGSHQVDSSLQSCPGVTPIAAPANDSWPAVALAGPKLLAVSGSHTCMLSTKGAVYCWGDNSDWAFGGSVGTSVNQPTSVNAGTWKEIAMGLDHTCAIDAAKEVFCWGLDRFGELGNHKRFHETPQPVTSH